MSGVVDAQVELEFVFELELDDLLVLDLLAHRSRSKIQGDSENSVPSVRSEPSCRGE
jgi:hypothetical protein